MAAGYPPPVERLLALGEAPLRDRDWLDYRGLGLGEEHVPALIRLATEKGLDALDPMDPRAWAPVHARRALGQLRAEAAVPALVDLLLGAEDDECAFDDLPEVLGRIGRPAVAPLARVLADSRRSEWIRIAAARGLKLAALADDALRPEMVALLTRQLEAWERQDTCLNSFLVGDLVDLEAVEAAPLMERAFAAGRVDPVVYGDWEDVRVELGLLPERKTPRRPRRRR
jgi:HEAT repeat protein